MAGLWHRFREIHDRTVLCPALGFVQFCVKWHKECQSEREGRLSTQLLAQCRISSTTPIYGFLWALICTPNRLAEMLPFGHLGSSSPHQLYKNHGEPHVKYPYHRELVLPTSLPLPFASFMPNHLPSDVSLSIFLTYILNGSFATPPFFLTAFY